MWVLPTKSTFILVTKRLLTWLRVNLTRNHVTKRHLRLLKILQKKYILIAFTFNSKNMSLVIQKKKMKMLD